MSDDRLPSWEQLYRAQAPETMPWYLAELDHDFAAVIERLDIRAGRALDLGTGPGTQALALAKLGLTVTATDISKTAVELARQKALALGLDIDFRQDDIVDTRLGGTFDYVFDRGCFHVIEPRLRKEYLAAVQRLLAAGGYLLLKCFSVDQPGHEGPYRFTREDIRREFQSGFEVLSIVDTVFQGNVRPSPKALFCVLRRQ